MAVLTGDTLFIGDVGRPDLLVSVGVTADDLGRKLYRSVHELLELPASTLVLPAHGAGSACGKALSTETVSTIGEQRRTNYAVQPMSEAVFVALVTEDQPAAPAYFIHAATLNHQERPLLHEGEPGRHAIDARCPRRGGRRRCAVVVDLRPVEDFAGGHLAGSLNVGLGGRFAEQVGSIVPVDTPIVFVGTPEAANEAKVRLARIGFDDIVGVLADVQHVLGHAIPSARPGSPGLTGIGPVGPPARELGDDLELVDVRNPGEVTAAPIDGARTIPLAHLRSRLGELDRDRPVVLVCAGGARSAIASSLLRSLGFAGRVRRARRRDRPGCVPSCSTAG